jgi:hypothetical protein
MVIILRVHGLTNYQRYNLFLKHKRCCINHATGEIYILEISANINKMHGPLVAKLQTPANEVGRQFDMPTTA